MNYLWGFFVASRPKTLIAALCPVIIGFSFSYYYTSYFNFSYFFLILTAALCIQISTNYFNDALDFEVGRDSSQRLGPQRAAASSLLRPRDLKVAALFLLAVAFVISWFLFIKAGWIVFAMGLPALFLAFLYTGTRFSLSANGTADLFVVLYFGLIPVWGTQFILSGSMDSFSLLSGFICGLFCNALLVINNLRDEKEDGLGNKKTLVVRYGRKFGLYLLFCCLVFPYVMNLAGFFSVFYRASFWSFLSLPLALFIFARIIKEKPSTKYNKYLALAALHLLLFSLIYSNGVLSS